MTVFITLTYLYGNNNQNIGKYKIFMIYIVFSISYFFFLT